MNPACRQGHFSAQYLLLTLVDSPSTSPLAAEANEAGVWGQSPRLPREAEKVTSTFSIISSRTGARIGEKVDVTFSFPLGVEFVLLGGFGGVQASIQWLGCRPLLTMR